MDYQSIYIDLIRLPEEKGRDKEDINDDIIFEIELICEYRLYTHADR